MAHSSSRLFSAAEVCELLEDSDTDEFENVSLDLNRESEDGEDQAGDCTDATGSQCLLSGDILTTDSSLLQSFALNNSDPSQRDSLLLACPDMKDQGKISLLVSS